MINMVHYYPVNIRRSSFHVTGKTLPVTSETAEKIESFRFLPTGWHFGEGGPADEIAIASAEEMLGVFIQNGVVDTGAFPGVAGEVMVTAYIDSHYVEAIAETDGS